MIDSDKVFAAMRADLACIRAELALLEELPSPAVSRITGNIRVIMLSLASRINELSVHQAARRMVGEEPALVRAAPVEELPIFAAADKALTAPEVARLKQLQSLHRAGDHSLDPEEEEA